jgi:hypothetical protein
MKTRTLVIMLGLVFICPWLVETSSPSPWMSYAQEQNKAKKDKQKTLNKLNQNIRKTETDQRKNRIRTSPKIHKTMPIPSGGG